MGTAVKMYAAGTGGTQDGIASIDVPLSGNLISVWWAVNWSGSADADVFRAQVSFGTAGNFATNDSRQVISEVRQECQLVTSGELANAINVAHPINLPVNQGERVYMHLLVTTSIASQVAAILNFDFDIDRPLARRR